MTQTTLTRAGTRAVPAQAEPPVRRRASQTGWWPLLFVGPFFLGIAVFYLFPILQTAYFSFTEWGAFGGVTFVGTDNYVRLASDDGVLSALVNTVVYIGIVLLGIPLAIWLSSLLNQPGLRFAMFYRTVFFLPYLAMPVAIALVWKLMFNGDFGLINSALAVIGIQGPYWLSTPGLALIALSIVGLWMSIGFNIIILSAGLRGIPPELYEAASLDGATRAQQFRRITIPLLTPSIFFVTVINVISGFQVFDLLYGLIGRSNPVVEQTQTLVYLFFNESFVKNDRGYGAVIALVILAIVAAVTVVQFRLQKKWVNYV